MKAVGLIGTVKNFGPISAGLNKLGIETTLVNSVEEAKEFSADFFVQTNIWSPFNKNKNLYKEILDSNVPRLVVESPPFRFFKDDKKSYRLSWNSFLLPDAVYPWQNDSSDRWSALSKKHNLKIKDWQIDGKYILIAIQKFSDSSLNSLYTENIDKPLPYYVNWLKSVIAKVKQLSDFQIVLRPHPTNNDSQIDKIKLEFKDCIVSRDDRYWKNAYCVLTYNSLFALDSLYNGIPVISLHNSSLHRFFSDHTLENLNNRPIDIDRNYIFQKLSYCQWNEDEVKQGVPFNRMLECMP
jgi:hypothetical protein